MTRDQLNPKPELKTQFKAINLNSVPEGPGSYALVTFTQHVLYVGKATSIRGRMDGHLQDALKQVSTEFGKVFWFYYLTTETAHEGHRIEHGWQNLAILLDGELPILNRVYTPA